MRRMVNRTSDKLALFEKQEIRKVWTNGEWYFSVEDVVYLLTDSNNTNDYVD